ncbi:MAG: polyphosphate kinase 2 [Aureispira sp.]|nr:polyphosphate kinase 2 [Aureispira sp.]
MSKELSKEDIKKLNSREGLLALLKKKKIDIHKVLERLEYESELEDLQVELVKLQRWVQESGKKVAIIFEGRDAAGKGGAIRRFTKHLSPRAMRVVALPKPTSEESGQWYFQRYVNQLPTKGEIVFFDRSWYNRAVVEPVNGFCSNEQYERFMSQVNEFEHMLRESGLILFKFWFDVSKDEQAQRFDDRRKDVLKQWKISPVDVKAQELWDDYTNYSQAMFKRTHRSYLPWVIIQADHKPDARLESMRYVLNNVDYKGKKDSKTSLKPNKKVIQEYQFE